ncbi:MAG: hypothetical protein GY696_20650, partial [Gammaproteobacteria bacterium]|nr:hypothetical protein [Gammaproteobacteria bacterium]
RHCDFCKSDTHNTEWCWADPRSAHYGEGWNKYKKQREEKKNEANAVQKRKSRTRCRSDSDESRGPRDRSEEDEKARRNFNKDRESVALSVLAANMLKTLDINNAQTLPEETKPTTATSAAKISTIAVQAETESDEAEYSGGIFGWLENEQGADAQGLVNALLQSDVMPPINC